MEESSVPIRVLREIRGWIASLLLQAKRPMVHAVDDVERAIGMDVDAVRFVE